MLTALLAITVVGAPNPMAADWFALLGNGYIMRINLSRFESSERTFQGEVLVSFGNGKVTHLRGPSSITGIRKNQYGDEVARFTIRSSQGRGTKIFDLQKVEAILFVTPADAVSAWPAETALKGNIRFRSRTELNARAKKGKFQP